MPCHIMSHQSLVPVFFILALWPSVMGSYPAPKVADEECLPFKLFYALSHEEGKLRTCIIPESTHSMWNNTKNAVRRSSLQHVLLLGSTMSNLAHGPFKSGRNQQSLQESARHLAATMSQESFEDLQDLMAADRGVDVDNENIPQEPHQIPDHPAITKLPVFVPCLKQCKMVITELRVRGFLCPCYFTYGQVTQSWPIVCSKNIDIQMKQQFKQG